MIHLDTHVVAWLYAGQLGRIPKQARSRIEEEEPWISPAVCLELQFLFEIGRVREPAGVVLEDLKERISLTVSNHPFLLVARAAAQLSWTRDPFDRLIAGQALSENATLLSADETMLEHLAAARWD